MCGIELMFYSECSGSRGPRGLAGGKKTRLPERLTSLLSTPFPPTLPGIPIPAFESCWNESMRWCFVQTSTYGCHGAPGHLPNAKPLHWVKCSPLSSFYLSFAPHKSPVLYLTLLFKRQSPSVPSECGVGAECLRRWAAEAGEADWLCSLISTRNYLRGGRRWWKHCSVFKAFI